jgi:hypothetical protein
MSSLSSTDFSLRSYTLLNKAFLPHRLNTFNSQSWVDFSGLKASISVPQDLVLLEANKSFLSDSSTIDTLLNFTEVAKIDSSASPYFTHMFTLTTLTTPTLWT